MTHPWRLAALRAWIRFEAWWYRAWPLPRGGAIPRRVERLLVNTGIIGPVRVEVEPGVNLLLDPTDFIARSLLLSDRTRWEPDVWNAIGSGLQPGAVFIDVGANIGYDSLKAARLVGGAGRVVACEPNPPVLALLQQNVAASQAANVTVLPVACADRETTLAFFDATDGGNSGRSSMSADNAGPGGRAITVQARRLDDIVADLGLTRLDVLKIDVEGAELVVLRGSEATLRRFQPKLVLEVIPRLLASMGSSPDELERWLGEHGYDRSRVIDHENREYWSSLSGPTHPA